jgi:hypothetical protein
MLMFLEMLSSVEEPLGGLRCTGEDVLVVHRSTA